MAMPGNFLLVSAVPKPASTTIKGCCLPFESLIESLIKRQGVGCPGVCPLPMSPHPSLIHQLQGAKHRHVTIVHAPPGRRPCVEID